MRFWILVLVTVPYINGQRKESVFECGSHGRFEYCIDGVPGCVIGCHCHPGYYFDTGTKICEPNIKLTQNFRRSDFEMIEPTRVDIWHTVPTVEKIASPKTAVDEKIDIITQDADDLGDWLYNQFFKTIENQVINETKDDSIITRRSENPPSVISKPTRRAHKYWRSKKRKKKKLKKGLRSKLLRITEDDSLFDSSSSSTSDESSDSSSSSSSSDNEKSREYKVKRKSDHGHKKIVVLNKRPKPPLPSFIFLPNMETPFYPPIGLPAPPMPMYPMVPVPPMLAPFPYPVPPSNGDSTTKDAGTTTGMTTGKTTVTTTIRTTVTTAGTTSANGGNGNGGTSKATTDAHTTTDKTANTKAPDENTEAADAATVADNEDNTKSPNDTLRIRGRKNRKNRPRNKLVQKLRDKLKRKNKLHDFFAQKYQDPEMQMMPPPGMEPPEGFIPMQLHDRQKTMSEINVEEELAGLQDVDFKYLSQLIHRADLNRTNQNSPHMIPLSTPLNDIMLTVPPPSRRNYGGYPDEMTQALSNLENHPANLNPENQPLYHSLSPDKYISNQPAYSSVNQFNGKQPTYKPPNQVFFGATNQQKYNVLDQYPYNPHNQQPFNTLNKNTHNLLTHNVPEKLNYNSPNKPFNTINQPAYNTPIKPSYSAPIQQSYTSPNLGESQVANHLSRQQMFNVPNQQPYKAPNQALNEAPNRSPYVTYNQQAYNALNQHSYNANQPTYVSLNKPLPSVPHRKKIEDTNDSYYSTLGRQIASMIRNIDGNKDIDIDIKASSNVPDNPILPGTGGSRSYWERYVRSPYIMIHSCNKENSKLKSSNEDLYNLEDKVSIAALKEPAMSLNELENIISQMQETKTKLTDAKTKLPPKPTKSSQINFNVDLQPDGIHYINYLGNDDKEKIEWILPAQNIPTNELESTANLKMLLYLKSNSSMNIPNPEPNTKIKNKNSPLRDHDIESLLTNFMFTLQHPNIVPNKTIFSSSTTSIPIRKPLTMPQIVYKMPNPHFKSYSYTALPLPLKPLLRNKGHEGATYMAATTKRSLYQQLSPMLLNHKKMHIYDRGNNNQYVFERTSIPLKQNAYGHSDHGNPYKTYATRVEPSYFHHEVHHFDYFDDLV